MGRPSWIPLQAYFLTLLWLAALAVSAIASDEYEDTKPDTVALYEKIKTQYADDVEGNWALARWCKRNGLQERRTQHLGRILELDPDHPGARRALGYFRVGDEWFTREQYMTGRGYVRYRGRWMLPQEKALLEEDEQHDELNKQWIRKIKLWISYAEDRRPELQERGLTSLRAIDDPGALAALDELLGTQEIEAYRLLLIEILSNMENPKVTSQLVVRSLTDPSAEVRSRAIELLAKRDDPDAREKYARALHSTENLVVRRAAAALGALGDPSVVPALIEALVTTHKVPIAPEDRSPSGFGFSSTTATPPSAAIGSLPGGVSSPIILPRAGGLGLSYGGGKQPRMVKVEIQNSEALFALNKLTGNNFGFDKEAWRRYWETERRGAPGASVGRPEPASATAPLRSSEPEVP